MAGGSDGINSVATSPDDSWRRWGIEWRSVLSHSTVYAFVLSLLLTADNALTAESLGSVPHPLRYFLPLLAVFMGVSAIGRTTGFTRFVDESVEAPMAVYLTGCLLIGAAWVLVR